MTEWEKAEAGLFYMPPNDPKIVDGMKKSQQLNYDYNMLRPAQLEEREKMIRDNFGKVGKNFYSNYNFKVLAGGNPCKVIREIKPEDDNKYREGFKCF